MYAEFFDKNKIVLHKYYLKLWNNIKHQVVIFFMHESITLKTSIYSNLLLNFLKVLHIQLF